MPPTCAFKNAFGPIKVCIWHLPKSVLWALCGHPSLIGHMRLSGIQNRHVLKNGH